MRAIWKGAVSFGLVSIAVKLYSATEEKDIRFHQVHRTDGGRIKYKRTCSVDGEEVTYDDIAKGYDIGGGETVILTDEDFADLPLTTSRAIDVLQFVPADQIDPIMFAKAYYLEPEGQAAKPYVLLRDALQDADRVAIVKIALRQREQLATLRVREDVLVLNTMLWPDEVRAVDFGFLDEEIETRPAELAMASSLIDSMAGSFKADEFTDNYRAALQEVIDAKVEGREIVQPEEAEEAPAAAVDLMAALKASVERAKKARGEAPEDRAKAVEATPIGAAKSAAKSTSSRTPTKSTPAKKAPAPAKTTAKKAAPAKTGTQAAAKSTGTTTAASKKAAPATKAARKSA
jgi:DNA end-binding protein Ku